MLALLRVGYGKAKERVVAGFIWLAPQRAVPVAAIAFYG